MRELTKLKELLEDLLIDYVPVGQRSLVLETKPVIITDCGEDGIQIFGWNFFGCYTYSAEFVAKALDRKFREEMEQGYGQCK